MKTPARKTSQFDGVNYQPIAQLTIPRISCTSSHTAGDFDNDGWIPHKAQDPPPSQYYLVHSVRFERTMPDTYP